METYNGNSHAQNGEREYQNSGRCECGSDNWVEFEMCDCYFGRECDKDKCLEELDKSKCVPVAAWKCERCGMVMV